MLTYKCKIYIFSVARKSINYARDHLIHDYMGVNYIIVWDVLENKIPELAAQIKDALGHEEN